MVSFATSEELAVLGLDGLNIRVRVQPGRTRNDTHVERVHAPSCTITGETQESTDIVSEDHSHEVTTATRQPGLTQHCGNTWGKQMKYEEDQLLILISSKRKRAYEELVPVDPRWLSCRLENRIGQAGTHNGPAVTPDWNLSRVVQLNEDSLD